MGDESGDEYCDNEQDNDAPHSHHSESQDDSPGTPDAIPTPPGKLGAEYFASLSSLGFESEKTNPSVQRPRMRTGLQDGKNLDRTREKVNHAPDADLDGVEYREILLRTADANEVRDYVVATFRNKQPDLFDNSKMILYRGNETTQLQRKIAIANDRKQEIFGSSEEFLPDRYTDSWTMEVTHEGEEGSGQSEINVFEGTFMGKPTSRYAIIAVGEDDTADVALIDPYSWFSFRSEMATIDMTGNDPQKHTDGERETAAEKKWKKANEVREKSKSRVANKFGRLEGLHEDAQKVQNQREGERARGKDSKVFAQVGLARNQRRQSNDADNENEDESGFDFEAEFDNDDMDMAFDMDMNDEDDKDDKFVLADKEENEEKKEKKLRMLQSGEASSDSDEEPDREGNPTSTKAADRDSSAVASKRKAATSSASKSSRKKSGPSGAPHSGSRPELPDLSHLLPRKGALPTAKHAEGVLSALSKQNRMVRLKDCVAYFENKNAQQKQNLRKIFSEVGRFLRKDDEHGRPEIYLMLKPSKGEAGPSRR